MALGSSWGAGLAVFPSWGQSWGHQKPACPRRFQSQKAFPRSLGNFVVSCAPVRSVGIMTSTLATEVGLLGGCGRQATPAPSPHRAGSVCPGCLRARRDPASSPSPKTRTLIPAAGGPSAAGPSPPASWASREPQIWPQQSPNSGRRMSPAAPSPAVGSHCAQAFGDTGLLLGGLDEFSGQAPLSQGLRRGLLRRPVPPRTLTQEQWPPRDLPAGLSPESTLRRGGVVREPRPAHGTRTPSLQPPGSDPRGGAAQPAATFPRPSLLGSWGRRCSSRSAGRVPVLGRTCSMTCGPGSDEALDVPVGLGAGL